MLFEAEVQQKLASREGHWHHYYGVEEVQAVLTYGLGVRDPEVTEHGGSLYLCFTK